MTLRNFLNASYALLVEGYLTVAPNRIDLMTAIDRVGDALPEMNPEPEITPKNVQAQNEQSMAQLQAMLAGVKM